MKSVKNLRWNPNFQRVQKNFLRVNDKIATEPASRVPWFLETYLATRIDFRCTLLRPTKEPYEKEQII